MTAISKQQKLINQVGFIKTQFQDVNTKLTDMDLFDVAKLSERLMDDCSELRDTLIREIEELKQNEGESSE